MVEYSSAMKDDVLKKLSFAYEYYIEVFVRHFKSADEAQRVGADAVAGDDRAQVRLWLFFQDARLDKSKQLKPYGQYTINRITVSKVNVLDRELAARFKELAREASNLDAVDFAPGVRLGNRDPLAHYPIYNHGRDDYYGQANLTFLENPHLRYKGDLWWNHLRRIDRRRDPYIYLTEASKHTTPDEFLTFYKYAYSAAITALEECAKAGSAAAAEELARLFLEPSLKYSLNKIFSSGRTVDNPYFDADRAKYWGRVHAFLSGQGEDKLLDKWILSQEDTPEGQFNIGVALLNNPSVRNAFGERSGSTGKGSDQAINFIKRAAAAGSAAAAWFHADLLHKSAESNGDAETMRAAVQWYRAADELGHPNAKHRHAYLSRKHVAPLTVVVPAVNEMPSEREADARRRPGIFLSHTRMDKPFVRQLARDLERLGARVWLDEAEIMLGDSLIEKISAGIDEMDYLAVVLSPDSVRSEWVKREVNTAMTQEIDGRRVKVLPLLYRPCDIPAFLRHKLYADFTVPDGYASGLQLVVDRLGLGDEQ